MEYHEVSGLLNEKKKCSYLRAELKLCLLKTDCCKYLRITPKQCLLQKHESVPQECYNLRDQFKDCKRSTLDPRRRFRGPRD